MSKSKVLYIYISLFTIMLSLALVTSFMRPYSQTLYAPILLDFSKVAFGALIAHLGTMVSYK